MRPVIYAFLIFFLSADTAFSGQSVIVEAQGTASMGDDRSRKQTVDLARQDAKKAAGAQALTYIKTETVVKNFVLEKDLSQAYSKAAVKLIEVIRDEWFNDPLAGQSYRVYIKAEVIPETEKKGGTKTAAAALDDPTTPLTVKAWSDKKTYREGEKMKFYIKGNKPFYLRAVYRDAQGNMLQILPNPHRAETYFHGGILYEIPSGEDLFELEVSPPFGQEKLMVYAGTSELGNISLSNAQSVYRVNETEASMGTKTRGLTLKKKKGKSGTGTRPAASEFFQTDIQVRITN